MAFRIESASFGNDERIPVRHTADGANLSPPLRWSELPPRARSLALVVEDPDAPGAFPFVHWLVYGIPAELGHLDEGQSTRLPDGLLQGTNSFGKAGYGGPAPPRGAPHQYQFHLYALDHQLQLKPGLDKKALMATLEGHMLSEALLVGVYQRD